MTPSAHLSPRTAARVVATIYGAILVILLLSPQPMERVLGLDLGARQRLAEQVANVLIFIPIGLAAARWRGAKADAVIVGLVVSIAAEAAQLLWLPQRDAAWTDVAKNVVGTAIGVLLARRPKATAPQPRGASPR